MGEKWLDIKDYLVVKPPWIPAFAGMTEVCAGLRWESASPVPALPWTFRSLWLQTVRGAFGLPYDAWASSSAPSRASTSRR